MLKKLYEQRAELHKQLQTLLSTAKTENRAMSAEENGKFEEIEGKINAIDTTIAAEERARKISQPAAPKGEEQDVDLEERAFADYIRGIAVENRAELTQGSNGEIVPTKIANRIIKAVKDKVPFFELADVVITNGKLSVPVYGEDAENYINADYVDEGTELADNVGKFTTINLEGYVLGALALVSNKLKDNTDIDVVSFIVTQVSEAIAEKLENEFINGSEGKISGILSSTNIVVAASATAITYDELIKLKHSIKQRFRSNSKWIMHPSTYTAICQLKDQNGQPYFKEEEYKILNLPVIESDSMPEISSGNRVIAFGELSGYTIKSTKKVEVQILREKFATKNMLGILAFCEFDGKITDGKKLAVLKMG